MPFLPYGYPSSSPRAHGTPNKSVPTLRYTRRHGSICTGPCPKALTECSPLDFRRSSIIAFCHWLGGDAMSPIDSCLAACFRLTAFVTKCFVQAAALGSDVITIEPSVVVRAVTWMTRYQNADGSFREPGHVSNQRLQVN